MYFAENPRLENQCENAAVGEEATTAAGSTTSTAAVDADSISKSGIRLGWPTIIAAFIGAERYSDLQGLRIALEEGLGACSVVPKPMSLAELVRASEGHERPPSWVSTCPSCGETFCIHKVCTRCEKCDSCSIEGNARKNSVADQSSLENCDE
jgi:hypothetical protein